MNIRDNSGKYRKCADLKVGDTCYVIGKDFNIVPVKIYRISEASGDEYEILFQHGKSVWVCFPDQIFTSYSKDNYVYFSKKATREILEEKVKSLEKIMSNLED